MPSPWRFEAHATHATTYYDFSLAFLHMGIDIIRKIHPTTSNGHEFILVAVDYFTKWVEVALFKVLNSKKVAQFIQTNIIYRYGVPHEIIFDNGLYFKGEIEKLLQQFNI